MSINVENGLISKLLETKDMALVKDMQIKPFFLEGESRRAFKYISDYSVKNGDVPTIRLFKQKFPTYKLDTYINSDLEESLGTEEPLKYWCDEVRNKVKHNKLASTTETMAQKLSDFDAEGAYELMKKTVLYMESEVLETKAIDITKNVDDRKAIYLKRKEQKGMIGIPTGIEQLDYILKGLQAKQLITMIATTSTGKTWFECIIGAYAQMNNYTVLQLTTEMSEEQLTDRYEAMLYGVIKGDFSYSRFKSGTLLPQEEEGYFDFLENVLPKLEPLIIETASGASSVSALIDKYNPDLVLIDSAYLMEDERGAHDDWLRVAHITRDLKAIAKNRAIPIFINTQADSTTSKKTGPELGNIGFSKAVGHDSDVVLALFHDEQMMEDKEMQIKVLKQREGVLGNVIVNWDFTTMNFSSIYSNVAQQEADNKTEKQSRGVIEL